MTELACRSCGHDWTYTGDLTDFTTCPSCSASVKLPSSDDGSKTADYDDKMKRLERRVEKLETEVDTLRKRQVDTGDDRKSKTTSEGTDDQKDETKAVYDPTTGF
jgi:phage shock protein A